MKNVLEPWNKLYIGEYEKQCIEKAILNIKDLKRLTPNNEYKVCKYCSARGWIISPVNQEVEECVFCKGRGYIDYTEFKEECRNKLGVVVIDCPNCIRGELHGKPCETCGGKGTIMTKGGKHDN